MTKINKHISIFGCGWVGLELGNQLAKANFQVKGSTTSLNKLTEINSLGIKAFQLDVNDISNDNLVDFLSADVLVFSIPPSKIDLKKLNLLIEEINKSKLRLVILTSSTGVYSDSNSIIDEESGKAFLNKTSLPYLVETVFKSTCTKPLTVLQLGGLIGPGRHPTKFISSKNVLANPTGRINYIERNDVIAIIKKIISEGISNETFICCADQHPTKKDYYTKLASALNLAIPQFESKENDTFKILDNQKIKRKLNFEFSDITKF